jgi:hypothetical protein
MNDCLSVDQCADNVLKCHVLFVDFPLRIQTAVVVATLQSHTIQQRARQSTKQMGNQ